MNYFVISLILIVLVVAENQELEIPPTENGVLANQECMIGTTFDLQDCYSYLTYQNMPYPPNSCCFVLQDLSSFEATGKSFTVCRCLRALVSDQSVISSRANVMAERCSVSFSFDVFTGMSCS